MLQQLLEWLGPESCVLCGREGDGWCKRCTAATPLGIHPPALQNCDGLVALGYYEGAIRDLVRGLKYDRRRRLANTLGDLIASTLPGAWNIDLVVSIPAAAARYRARGFNQSERIAVAVAKQCALPYRPVLRRIAQTQQVGSDRTQRTVQAATSYALRLPEFIPGSRILIVDDVTTTGATISAVSAVLKQAGAQAVYGGAAAYQAADQHT